MLMKKYLKSRFPALAAALSRVHRRVMRFMPMEYVFTRTYEHGGWGSAESVSGRGSTLAETEVLRSVLPKVFEEAGIESLLDVPCGDFNWMQEVAPSLKRYIGADIVKPLIEENLQRYPGEGLQFVHLNAMKDPLPKVDCILCRDMLVHFPLRDIALTIANFKASGSRYLLATTFPATETNTDIDIGEWRMINLEKAPFHFPSPLRMIAEHCASKPDKSLGLWRLSDIP
jgi:hypothetical protein